jgi:hypothetical protein
MMVSVLADWEGYRFFVSAAYHDRRYDGAPPGTTSKRHDKVQEYSAWVSRQVGHGVTLSLSDLYTTNDSNISFYEYTRNIIGIFAEIRL